MNPTTDQEIPEQGWTPKKGGFMLVSSVYERNTDAWLSSGVFGLNVRSLFG